MDRYVVISNLGSGSFGIVDLAKRVDDGSLCAVKQTSIAHLSPTQQQSAENEAQILLSLREMSVVRSELRKAKLNLGIAIELSVIDQFV